MSGVGPPAIRPRSTPGGDDQPCYMSGVGPPAMWPRKPPRQEATNYAHEPLVGELQRPRNQHTNPLWVSYTAPNPYTPHPHPQNLPLIHGRIR
eukprot:gene7277-biopygen7531